MADNEKFASEMRDAVKAMMEADPYYFDVPIITERLQNIDAKVESIVGKAGGICIVLVTATFEKPLVNLPGANFEVIRFIARVFENVKTNPTGKEALHVALYTAAFLSQVKPDALSSTLKLDDPGVALGNDPRFLTYDVSALTSGGTKIEIPRLEDLVSDFIFPSSFPHLTFNDGSRDYVWNVGNASYVSGNLSDAHHWILGVTPSTASGSGNEEAFFVERVDSADAATWYFHRIAGVWTLIDSTNPGESASPAPVIQEGFSFYSGSGIVLEHPTPGAAIFFTLNGSSPAPRNPNARLFISPFGAAPGVTVRARAWLPGYIPSAEKKQTL